MKTDGADIVHLFPGDQRNTRTRDSETCDRVTDRAGKQGELQRGLRKWLSVSKTRLRIMHIVTRYRPAGMGGGGQMNTRRFPSNQSTPSRWIAKWPLFFFQSLLDR